MYTIFVRKSGMMISLGAFDLVKTEALEKVFLKARMKKGRDYWLV